MPEPDRIIIVRPSPLQRFFMLLSGLAIVVLGLILLIPVLIVLGTIALLTIAWVRLRLWWQSLRRHGPLDGRRNVRVLDR